MTLQRHLDESGYHLVIDEQFDGTELDERLWIPHHLPHWSSREASRARYDLVEGQLQLLIEADQDPWCPELDGEVRVSSLQTGLFAGALGSSVGQHHFHPDAVVREEQDSRRLYTPREGVFVLRARTTIDADCMAALWMIGMEQDPAESGVIDIFEIFGSEASPERATVKMNLKPFADPTLTEDLHDAELAIDVREFHEYAVAWDAGSVTWFVDGRKIRTVNQSPQYPMQFMLGLYEFAHGDDPAAYPQRLVVDSFRAYERR